MKFVQLASGAWIRAEDVTAIWRAEFYDTPSSQFRQRVRVRLRGGLQFLDSTVRERDEAQARVDTITHLVVDAL